MNISRSPTVFPLALNPTWKTNSMVKNNWELLLEQKPYFLVWLVGGYADNSGNVVARNPATGAIGPVCAHGWTQTDVSCFGLVIT